MFEQTPKTDQDYREKPTITNLIWFLLNVLFVAFPLLYHFCE